MAIRVIVAGTEEARGFFASYFSDERFRIVGSVPDTSDQVSKLDGVGSDALVVYARMLNEQSEAFLKGFYVSHPGSPIIMLSPRSDTEMFARAMDCGVSKVFELERIPRSEILGNIVGIVSREHDRASRNAVAPHDSQVIAFFGTKGGTGKTSLAVNTALVLAGLGKRTALLDLDFQFGDIGIFLDIDKGDSIVSVIEEHDFSAAALESNLFTYGPGLKVLCAPSSPEYADMVEPTHVTKLIESLKSGFDYLVLDLPPQLEDRTMSALDCASIIYLVVNPDISSLHCTRSCLDAFSTIGLSESTKIVLNKEGLSNISRNQVKDVCGHELSCVVPYDPKTAVNAVNSGVPFVLSAQRSKIAQRVSDFAKRMCG